MFISIVRTIILLSCLAPLCLQAQDNSTDYKVHNTWDYSTEEINELPYIIGISLIQKQKINSVAIRIATLPMGNSSTTPTNLSFGGLVVFNKEGLKSFSSAHKVLDWEKYRPKPSAEKIEVAKKDKYCPIRYGSLYYSYQPNNYRTTSFFFKTNPASLPEGYLNYEVHRSTDRYKTPHHLHSQNILPEVLKDTIIKENGEDINYYYEKTEEGFTETIVNNNHQNFYNHKKQLIRTYEMTIPFRIYVEEHFYHYNKQGLVKQHVRTYEEKAHDLITRDSSIYTYNKQNQLVESLRTYGYSTFSETYEQKQKIHAAYYYNAKGLLRKKVITNLLGKVRHICTYIYNPSPEAIREMPD